MIRLAEMIFPVYLLITIGFAMVVVHSNERSLFRDPRFPKVAIRFVLYPAILFSILIGGLLAAGAILGQGVWWGLPAAAVIGVITVGVVAKLGVIAVGSVLRILRNPPQ